MRLSIATWPVEDERLVARTREFGDVRGEHAVEPLAGLVGGDHQFLAAPLFQGLSVEAMSQPGSG